MLVSLWPAPNRPGSPVGVKLKSPQKQLAAYLLPPFNKLLAAATLIYKSNLFQVAGQWSFQHLS